MFKSWKANWTRTETRGVRYSRHWTKPQQKNIINLIYIECELWSGTANMFINSPTLFFLLFSFKSPNKLSLHPLAFFFTRNKTSITARCGKNFWFIPQYTFPSKRCAYGFLFINIKSEYKLNRIYILRSYRAVNTQSLHYEVYGIIFCKEMFVCFFK